MSEAAYELGVVCEARADRDTSCELADRVLVEQIDWLEPEMLESQRKWRGLTSDTPFLRWASVYGELKRSGLKGIFGHFNGAPGAPDALVARQALLLLAMSQQPPAAVLLVRDSDGDERRRTGLEQARSNRPWPFEVVIGVAEPKREVWALVGFDPRGADEEARLREVEKRLSFHPVREAHRLDAREHGAKNDAKRALEELTADGKERERECWRETPLDTLAQRGHRVGLSQFLAEVRERLVPLVSGAAGGT